MSDTPISDATPHNVAELGMLCRRLERGINEANAIIRQQQLLEEDNLGLKERIKRLEDIIKRTATRFFEDGSDSQTAVDMLKILNET